MEIQEIEKQKMDSLKALAETNLKVSAAQEKLANLKKEEFEHAEKQKVRSLENLQVILDESQRILEAAFDNYKSINELATSSSELTEKVDDLYEEFIKYQATFTKKVAAWNGEVADKEKELEKIKQLIVIDQHKINADRESLERRKIIIQNEERKLRDGRETLERALNRLTK